VVATIAVGEGPARRTDTGQHAALQQRVGPTLQPCPALAVPAQLSSTSSLSSPELVVTSRSAAARMTQGLVARAQHALLRGLAPRPAVALF
jgi:hypothetical protein